MTIEYDSYENVNGHREVYASTIRIDANPVDTSQSVITLDLSLIEYRNGEYVGKSPMYPLNELAGDFAGREFVVGDKTITGLEVVKIIKMFTAVKYAEHTTTGE